MKNTELIVAIENLLLNSSHQMDKLESLAEAYAEACQALNSSLLRCITVLRDGNSVEAIRLAHSEHVLEDYDTLVLDFTNRDLWLEAVKTFTEVRIPSISDEMAEELDTCEKKVEDQKDILKRHRLLAYSNGPMFKRIQVLRRLIARNPKFFEWQKDLESYIQCYYDQLSHEVPKIDKLSGITQIEEEINSVSKISNEIPTLSANAPTSLVMSIQARKEKLVREDIQKRRDIIIEDLKKITAALAVSYQQQHFESGEEALNFWNICVERLKKLNAAPPQDIQKRAAVPLQWIRNEKARIIAENEYYKQRMLFERSVGADNIPLISVQKNYMKLEEAARRANILIPDNLVAAMQNREKKWSKQRFRKKVFSFMIFLIVLGSLGTAGYFGSKYWLQNQFLADLEKNLVKLQQNAQDSSDYTSAMKEVNRIEKDHPEVLMQSKKIRSLTEEIREKDRENYDRQEQFKEKAEGLTEKIVNNKSSDPDLENQLSKLKLLARTKDENEQYKELSAKYAKNMKNQADSQNRKFENEANSLLSKIKNLDVSTDNSPTELDRLKTQIEELEKWPEPVAESLKKERITALSDALSRKVDERKSHQKDLNLQKNYAKAFDDLLEGSKDVSSFIRNLEKYLAFVRENPSKDSESQEVAIEKRLEEKEVWKRIDEWNKFMELNGSVLNADRITPEMADGFLREWDETGESLLVDKDQSWNKTLLNKIASLQKTQSVNTISSSKIVELQSLCDEMSKRDYWYARSQKGKGKDWYYFVENTSRKPKYVNEWDDVDGNNYPSENIFPSNLQPSLHVKLCNSLLKTTKKLEDNFEENALLILEKILTTYSDGLKGVTKQELDPLVAWYLLTAFTESLGECNADFQKAFDPILKNCNRFPSRLTLARLNLPKPNELTREQREMATKIMNDILDEQMFEKCKETFQSNSKMVTDKCAGIYRLVGIVIPDGNHFTIHGTLPNSTASGPLWVCRENSDLDTEIEFREIGRIKKGEISPDFTKAEPSKFQFAPVFVFEYVK